jgi:predicted AlkP superfamily pyrophosphatase or phosphodiesterase
MPKVDASADKTALVHAPTIYDLAYKAGLTTAQVDWVAINQAKTITWQFPELPDPAGEIERELIADHVVTVEELRTYENSTQAWQDQIWTDAAVRILEEHRPNLLMFHLLGVDDANHEYGPMSNASLTAMAALDARVKRILDVVEKQGFSPNVTLIIVSDHGFRKVEHTIRPNTLLRDSGMLRQSSGVWRGDAWIMSEGGTADVYVTDPARKKDVTSKIRKLLEGKEGIQGIYGTEDFAKLGYPLPERSSQGPDMVITGVAGYMFSSEPEGDYSGPPTEGGTHGFINDDPQMQAIFLAWGADVPHGVRLGAIANLDVAPTIAKLLGLEMEHVKGHPIPQIVDRNPVPAGSTK